MPFSKVSLISQLWIPALLAMSPLASYSEDLDHSTSSGATAAATTLPSETSHDGTRSTPLQTGEVHTQRGPWGTVEYYTVYLTAPQSYVDAWSDFDSLTEWHFGKADPETVREFLSGLNVQAATNDPEPPGVQVVQHPEGLTLRPNESMILSLTSEQRQKIAQELDRLPQNRFYVVPILIESGDPSQWFSDAGLDAETIELIQRFCYRRGDAVLFSDVPYVLGRQETPDAKKKFLRAMSRTRSLVLRLKIEQGTDLSGIVDYWTAGHKRKDLDPILESVLSVPDVERIDVLHFLPPTPRMLLYTYPDLRSSMSGELRDCHWTSSNFFRSRPQGVIANSTMRGNWMFSDLEAATGDPQFGDTIVISARDTRAILHSMTYIAADVVFTKNGASLFRPWVFMKYDDVLARYSFLTETTVEWYRPKSP